MALARTSGNQGASLPDVHRCAYGGQEFASAVKV